MTTVNFIPQLTHTQGFQAVISNGINLVSKTNPIEHWAKKAAYIPGFLIMAPIAALISTMIVVSFIASCKGN